MNTEFQDIKIAVAGTGYVGLSIATLLSQHHKVTAVDVIPEKVEKLNNKISPIQDEYIEKYLAEKDLNLNVYVRTQVKTINGRADMVVKMPDAIYVLELKICSEQSDASHLKNGTAKEALQQINSRGYAIPYQTDGRRVVKVGIRFSTETLAIEGLEIEG